MILLLFMFIFGNSRAFAFNMWNIHIIIILVAFIYDKCCWSFLLFLWNVANVFYISVLCVCDDKRSNQIITNDEKQRQNDANKETMKYSAKQKCHNSVKKHQTRQTYDELIFINHQIHTLHWNAFLWHVRMTTSQERQRNGMDVTHPSK